MTFASPTTLHKQSVTKASEWRCCVQSLLELDWRDLNQWEARTTFLLRNDKFHRGCKSAVADNRSEGPVWSLRGCPSQDKTERRRALDRIAHHFRLRTYFRLVARAKVVASVVELGPDVVVVVVVNAFVVCVAAGIDVDGLNVVRVDVGIGFVVFGRDRRWREIFLCLVWLSCYIGSLF